jgi:hypothetical protein
LTSGLGGLDDRRALAAARQIGHVLCGPGSRPRWPLPARRRPSSRIPRVRAARGDAGSPRPGAS